VTAARALELESRSPRRRRERGTSCADRPSETGPDARMAGVPAGGRLTLGQLLDGVWEGLHAGGAARCPMCHGEMRRSSAQAAARCAGCGTTLS
jgi:hypothetical protein